ncbi:TolC family protein [Parapedobacter deserti]|uniref:TolC family protein n=1 Tax=Parapedobacter deserti TaxID=1912957 RepID=A0ABV7JEG0_9SPHI
MKIVYAIGAALLLAGSVSAQTVLSLEDAISYALANSTVLEKARLDIEQGQEVVAETRAGALPQVNVTSSVTGNPIVQQFVLPAEAFGGAPGEFMAIRAGQSWNAMTQVQLTQQLFNKQLFAGIKAAKGSAEYYQMMKDLSEQNVIQQVAVNYYMVIINREKLDVVASNIARISELEKIVRGQYESGLAKKIDLDRILVNKSNQEAQHEELRRALTHQENLLKYYMDMPIDEEIALPELALEELERSTQLAATASKHQVQDLLDYQVLKKQEELLQYERKARRGEYFPTLSLDANYVFNTQSNKLNLYSSNALNFDMSAISLRLSIPIFDGFAKRSRIRQSDIALRKIGEDIRNTGNSLMMASENAANQVRSSSKTVANQKANMHLAMDVFLSTQNNYRNGLATLTDLLNAESELVVAQNSYNEALLNFKIAEIDLARSRGEIKSIYN